LLIPIVLLLFGCKEEIVPEQFRPRNEHEAYLHNLQLANLQTTAMGRDWIDASEQALEYPVKVKPPFQEVFYLDHRNTEAVGYRFSVKRGQKIIVDIKNQTTLHSTKLFIDLFRVSNDSLKDWRHVATADTVGFKLAFEPRRDADYILRLQTELLRGGKFTVIIRKVASIDFPVAGKTSRAISSYFGDARDGGRREHHGVDIFAKRHTPIIAPAKGYVRFVGKRGMGGNVVWIYDSKRHQSLYFAHLETQTVRRYTYVNPGDTIGTVGNSGNARNTPPHLHFGIYKNGPLDPYYFISKTDDHVDSISVFTDFLGSWIRATQTTFLQASPVLRSEPLDTLESDELMIATGAARNFYRVALPNGLAGYVKALHVELADEPISELAALQTHRLLEEPGKYKMVIENLKSGEEFSVIGKFKGFWYIRSSLGKVGWMYRL